MSAKSKLSAAQKKNIRDMCHAGIPKSVIARKYAISESYVGSLSYGYEGSGHYAGRDERTLRTGITPQMIRRVRESIHPGSRVVCMDKAESDGRVSVSRHRCRVVDIYPYLFTVKRPFGIESFTYTDLIRRDGVRMEDV